MTQQKKQIEIDWAQASNKQLRSWQLQLIDDFDFNGGVANDGSRVSSEKLYWVLKVIDEFNRGKGDCYAGISAIAKKARVSPRQTARAVEALAIADLLTCERQKVTGRGSVTCNHYRINWTTLARLNARGKVAVSDQLTGDAVGVAQNPTGGRSLNDLGVGQKPDVAPEKPDVALDQSAVVHSDVEIDQSAVALDQSAVAHPIQEESLGIANNESLRIAPTASLDSAAKEFVSSNKHVCKTSVAAFPTALDTPEFRAAWLQWEQHRREIRKRLTPGTIAKQIARLASLGSVRAVLAIDYSIEHGWMGIFEPPTARSYNGANPRKDYSIPHFSEEDFR